MVSGLLDRPVALPRGYELLLLLDRRLGETHSWCEHWGEERSLLALPEIESRFVGRQTPLLVPILIARSACCLKYKH
jgi:hypothetical protein